MKLEELLADLRIQLADAHGLAGKIIGRMQVASCLW